MNEAPRPRRALVRAVILALAAFRNGAVAGAADVSTGFLDRAITLDGALCRYQVYVPADYTPAKAWPVVVSLHGNGRQGSDGLRQTSTDFAAYIRDGRREGRRERGTPFPAIVVFPQAQAGTRWFYPGMERLVMAELDRTIAEFRIDPARVYLQGYSMGGSGSYRLAALWPERFAAVVVVAGRVLPGANYSPEELEIDGAANPAAASPDPFAAFAAKLGKTPLWIFHGDADAVISVDESRQLVGALRAAGAPVRYTECPGADHMDAPAKAYSDPELFRWLFDQRRGAGGE